MKKASADLSHTLLWLKSIGYLQETENKAGKWQTQRKSCGCFTCSYSLAVLRSLVNPYGPQPVHHQHPATPWKLQSTRGRGSIAHMAAGNHCGEMSPFTKCCTTTQEHS